MSLIAGIHLTFPKNSSKQKGQIYAVSLLRKSTRKERCRSCAVDNRQNLNLKPVSLTGMRSALSCHVQLLGFHSLLPGKPLQIPSPLKSYSGLPPSPLKLSSASSSPWQGFSVPLDGEDLTALRTLVLCSEWQALGILRERFQGGAVHKSSSGPPKGLCKGLECSWHSLTCLCMPRLFVECLLCAKPQAKP